MSRLDSFINRLEAQRLCLDAAPGLIAGLPGPVLELGLGHGRTYDHLRCLFPEREIFVFERAPAAHPACTPDTAHLILGDIRETLATASARLPGLAALAHSDVGTGDEAFNAELARWLADALPSLLQPGALVMSDQALRSSLLLPLAPPPTLPAGRYFLYRRWS